MKIMGRQNMKINPWTLAENSAFFP